MKKEKLLLSLLLIMVIIVLIITIFHGSYALLNENGWSPDNKYYYRNGEKVTGYQIIDNKRYYFNIRSGYLILDNNEISNIEKSNIISYDYFYHIIENDNDYKEKDESIKDIDILYMTHDFANWEKYYKYIDNATVTCGQTKNNFLIKGLMKDIVITTDVDWNGCTFTFDDTNVKQLERSIFTIANNLYLKTNQEYIALNNATIDSLNNKFKNQFDDKKVNMIQYSKELTNIINNLTTDDIAEEQQVYINDIKDEISNVNKFLIRVVSTNQIRYIRSGSNQDNGQALEDFYVVNKNGTILQDLIDTLIDNYSAIDKVYVYPIYDNGIIIDGNTQNAIITTKTNNKVYNYNEETNKCYKSSYINRNIKVIASNVTIKNLKHYLDESQDGTSKCQNIANANLYNGIIYSQYNYNFKMENILLSRHTASVIPKVLADSSIEFTETENGTYDFQTKYLINPHLKNVKTAEHALNERGEYEAKITSDMNIFQIKTLYEDIIRYDQNHNEENLVRKNHKWSVHGINNFKNLVMENCIGIEIGAHTNANNPQIVNSITSTIITQGYGNMLIDNSLIYDLPNHNTMIYLRSDYGGSWDGNIIINNAIFIANNSNNTNKIIVHSDYNKDHNYGYELHFPSLYINGLTIDTNNTNNVYLMAMRDGNEQAGSFCTLEKDFAKHYINKNIILSNINIYDNILHLFTDKFLNGPCTEGNNEAQSGFFSQTRYLNNGIDEQTMILIDNNIQIDKDVNDYKDGQNQGTPQFVITKEEITSYNIEFNPNGGLGSMTNQYVLQNLITAINKNVYTRSGYRFIGWNTQADGTGTAYNDNQLVALNTNIKLYAMWMPNNPYTINKYNYDEHNKYIDRIDANTTVEELKNNIELDPDFTIDIDYKIINNNKIIYTGGKTRIYYNNNLYIELTNVVPGDVNGDGIVDITDARNIAKNIISHNNLLVMEYLRAADYNGDERIRMNDVIKMIK